MQTLLDKSLSSKINYKPTLTSGYVTCTNYIVLVKVNSFHYYDYELVIAAKERFNTREERSASSC